MPRAHINGVNLYNGSHGNGVPLVLAYRLGGYTGMWPGKSRRFRGTIVGLSGIRVGMVGLVALRHQNRRVCRSRQRICVGSSIYRNCSGRYPFRPSPAS
jgi:hypothetical protein